MFGQFPDATGYHPVDTKYTGKMYWLPPVMDRKRCRASSRRESIRATSGSLTSLKNGLSAEQAGECDAGNQLDERVIPALVIAGGNNPLKDFGAKLGDLVFAFNPSNGVGKAAVIGDVGPPDNLGEGSVALNMALLKVEKTPSNYNEAKTLDTGEQDIVVAIMPGTRSYKLERPYSDRNISSRVDSWIAEHGYRSIADLTDVMKVCVKQLRQGS